MKTIEFKIVFEKNPNVYQSGYCEVPADVDECSEWFFYNQSGLTQPRAFTHHDEIGIDQIGATDKQSAEVEEFKDLIVENADFVNETIETASEFNDRTYIKNGLIIVINEGAKLDINVCNYSSDGEWNSDYYLGFRIHFNGELVELDEEVYFEDPYTYEQTKVSDILKLSHNLYVVEVPKDYFDVDYDDPWRREVIDAYKEAFEKAYRETLVREVGVFGIASSMLENKFKRENDLKVFNESLIQDFGNQWEDNFIEEDLVKLYHLTDEDVEKAVMDDLEDE